MRKQIDNLLTLPIAQTLGSTIAIARNSNPLGVFKVIGAQKYNGENRTGNCDKPFIFVGELLLFIEHTRDTAEFSCDDCKVFIAQKENFAQTITRIW